MRRARGGGGERARGGAGGGPRGAGAPGFAAALAFALFLVLAPSAAGQGVEGRVLDAGSRAPVGGATVTLLGADDRRVARVTTGADGSFLLSARTRGEYRIQVQALGYASPDLLPLALDDERIVVEILLGPAPLALDPLTVTGRRIDPRHERSFEGAVARHSLFPQVGSRRVVMRGDLEMQAAGTVGGILQLMGFPSPCTIVWWNGSMVATELSAEMWIDYTSAEAVEAVEYYRRWSDAPMGYRDFPAYIEQPAACRVVALWPRLDPVASRHGLLRRAGSGAFLAGALWALGRLLMGG